jgi:hypothetical protein
VLPRRSRSNEAPTAVEAERIHRFIKARRGEIAYITIGIEGEDAHIEMCHKAIANLEIAIPRGKDILKAHEDNLTALLEIQSRLLWLKQLDTLELELEPRSRRLYREVKTFGDAPLPRMLNSIDNEVKPLKEEVERLCDGVVALEKELEGWNSSLILFQCARNHLITSRTQLEGDLSTAIASLKIFLRIPAEIWRGIFRIAVSNELNEYLEERRISPLLSTAHTLIQVCASWRHMAMHDALLWRNIAVHASQCWPRSKYRLFTRCISRTNSPINLVADLSPNLTWTKYSSTQCRSSRGSVSIAAHPDWTEALGEKDYNLHIVMSEDDEISFNRATYLPFRTPDALTIACHTALQSGSIRNILSTFQQTKSLTLILNNAENSEALDIASDLPQLESLTFKVEIPPKVWQFSGILSPTLRQLHICHVSDDMFTTLVADAELPHLTVLGITGPGTNFLQHVRMPSLQTVVFYGYTSAHYNEIAPGNLAMNTYGLLHQVVFEGWLESDAPGIGGAVSYFGDLAIKTPGIRSVKFVQSWVDGTALTTLLNPSLQGKKAKPLVKLEEVILDRPCGIERKECEDLKSLVKKVNVYM